MGAGSRQLGGTCSRFSNVASAAVDCAAAVPLLAFAAEFGGVPSEFAVEDEPPAAVPGVIGMPMSCEPSGVTAAAVELGLETRLTVNADTVD